MATFKTPKWGSSENDEKTYKNVFGKQKKVHFPKDNKKMHKNKKKQEKLSPHSHTKPKINKNTLKAKEKSKIHLASVKVKDNSKNVNLTIANKQNQGVGKLIKQNATGKTNEYHTLLKSRKQFMKLSLRERMIERLKSSRFRYINEELYTKEGKLAKDIFKRDPNAFTAYHEGYKQQVSKWPMNPLDIIINSVKKMSADKIIADMGCGDAKLAQSVNQKVYSFDLQAVNDFVTECEMSKVPLEKGSVDVVVFCLSLMGTNIKDFLFEANRILKIGGILKIAEVQSRFEKVDVFIKGVEQFGFKHTWKDLSKDLFYFMDFKKKSDCRTKQKLPTVSLLPCLYKKR